MSFASNPYQSSGYAVAANAGVDERADFMSKTYLHLAGAIGCFVVLEAALLNSSFAEGLIQKMIGGSYSWLIVLGAFMGVSWLADSWARSAVSVPLQYAGLALYVVAQAVLFVPLLFIAQFYVRDPYLIPAAGLITLIMFGGLTVVVFLTKADFSFLRAYLVWGGILAIGLIVCAAIFGLSLGVWFSVALIALASGYILYDTSNILHHYRTDQYVAAALALFASVALLFWYVIRLLMYLNGRD